MIIIRCQEKCLNDQTVPLRRWPKEGRRFPRGSTSISPGRGRLTDLRCNLRSFGTIVYSCWIILGLAMLQSPFFVKERCITNTGEISLSLNTKIPVAPPQLPCCVKVISFCVLSLRPVLCLFVGQRHPGRLSAGINLRAGFSPIWIPRARWYPTGEKGGTLIWCVGPLRGGNSCLFI